jgi:uncharacterized protein involved in response to NO
MNAGFWSRISKDPFRVFFPLGIALAVLGLVPWIVGAMTHASYPRDLHRVLMIDGFLLSFVCGFLMTAIPRFTSASHATRLEVTSAFALLALAAVGAFFAVQTFSYLCAALALLGLMRFAVLRFLKRAANPPHTFIFIGVGLFLWLIANLVEASATLGFGAPELSIVAGDLFSNGVIMCLIFGVGGRLIPAILGWQEIVGQPRASDEAASSYFSSIPPTIRVAIGVFLFSFFARPWLPLTVCMSLRATVSLYFAFAIWRIHRLPPTKSYLSIGIWFACWSLALGYLVPIVWPESGVHGLHVLFISGFSLLTLLISMRVSFAHSAAGTSAEKTSPSILVFCGLIVFAMVTRVTAILWPRIYIDHLGYASATWLIGMVVWVWVIVRRIELRRPQ